MTRILEDGIWEKNRNTSAQRSKQFKEYLKTWIPSAQENINSSRDISEEGQNSARGNFRRDYLF